MSERKRVHVQTVTRDADGTLRMQVGVSTYDRNKLYTHWEIHNQQEDS